MKNLQLNPYQCRTGCVGSRKSKFISTPPSGVGLKVGGKGGSYGVIYGSISYDPYMYYALVLLNPKLMDFRASLQISNLTLIPPHLVSSTSTISFAKVTHWGISSWFDLVNTSINIAKRYKFNVDYIYSSYSDGIYSSDSMNFFLRWSLWTLNYTKSNKNKILYIDKKKKNVNT